MVEVKIHRLAKYKKLEPLEFYYNIDRPVLRRWTGDFGKPNAMALEDIIPGSFAKVDTNGGIAEVRNG